MRSIHALCLLTLALCASLVQAAPDLSTPKSAALAFGNALVAGDVETMKASAVGTDAEFKSAEALGQILSTFKKVSDAATAKWGKDNAITKAAKDPDIAGELEKSDIKIEGDTATIVNKDKDDKKPTKLVRKEGVWKFDLSSLPKDAGDDLIQMAPVLSKIATELVAEIKAGKYATAEDAQAAIGGKVLAATLNSPAGPAAPAPAPEKK